MIISPANALDQITCHADYMFLKIFRADNVNWDLHTDRQIIQNFKQHVRCLQTTVGQGCILIRDISPASFRSWTDSGSIAIAGSEKMKIET